MIEQQGVSNKTFGVIKDKFQDRYAVFAYLIFILLYVPCVATMAVSVKLAHVGLYLLLCGAHHWLIFNFKLLSAFKVFNAPHQSTVWLVFICHCNYTGFYQFLKGIQKANRLNKLNTL